MNQFANLSSENEVSALAQVTVEEYFLAPMTPVTPFDATMSRYAARNERAATLKPRHAAKLHRFSMLDIHAAIHAECADERAALRATEQALDSI